MSEQAPEAGLAGPWDVGMGRAGGAPLEGRRSDAGSIRLTARDRAALLWCGEMYGVRADLLARLVGVNAAAVRGLHMRWRRAGFVATGTLGPGGVWCWLTRAGLEACGLPFEPRPPALARVAHVHAVGAVRLALEGWDRWREAGAVWRPERELRWRLGGGVGHRGHVPDGEVLWPDAGPFGGQVWCVEVELTAKTVERTAQIMTGLVAREAGYGEGDDTGPVSGPRYARVVYVVAAGARGTVERARALLPPGLAGRVEVRDAPAGALP